MLPIHDFRLYGALMGLALSRWVDDGKAVLITGPAGSGKSWLACALAQYACPRGHSALYLRAPRLAEELHILHRNGASGAGWPRWPALTCWSSTGDLATLDGPRARACWRSSTTSPAAAPPSPTRS